MASYPITDYYLLNCCKPARCWWGNTSPPPRVSTIICVALSTIQPCTRLEPVFRLLPADAHASFQGQSRRSTARLLWHIDVLAHDAFASRVGGILGDQPSARRATRRRTASGGCGCCGLYAE